ncbi:MAG: hypothetical protein JXL80_03225 [Planctomycetes bacterium]|nr:hypothetical protein [Planctomycetota bacterium]
MRTCRVIGSIVAMVLSAGNSDLTGQELPSELSRTQVFTIMQSRIALSDGLSATLSEEQRTELLRYLRDHAERVADSALPERLEAVSGRDMARAVPNRVLVTSNNLAIEKLRVTKAFMDVTLNTRFQQRYQNTVTPDTLESLRTDVGRFTEGIRTAMETHLLGPPPLFSREEIAAQVESTRKDLLAHIGNANSYWMTQSVSKESLAEAISGLEERLVKCKEQIKNKLDEQGTETTNAESIAPGPVGIHSLATATARAELLREITHRAAGVFLRRSTDPELASIDPEELVPGYRSLVKELVRMERETALEAERKWHADHPPEAERPSVTTRLAESQLRKIEKDFGQTISMFDSLDSEGSSAKQEPSPGAAIQCEEDRTAAEELAQSDSSPPLLGIVLAVGACCAVLAGWAIRRRTRST